MKQTYDIAGIKIALDPICLSYFEDNLLKYKTEEHSEYEINSHLVESISKINDTPFMSHNNRKFYKVKDKEVLHILHASGEVKIQIIYDQAYKHQDISFVGKYVRDLEEMEYILYSMQFLEIAIRNGFVALHASSLLIDTEVILFSAPSRTGKSTHVNYYTEVFEHAQNINDDKPLIKDGLVYGTPFSGKGQKNINTAYPLKAIVFIEQGQSNDIEPLNHDKSLKLHLKNILRPSKESDWNIVIPTLNQILKLPTYKATLTNSQVSIFTTYFGIHKENIMRIKSGFTVKEIGSKYIVVPVEERALDFNGIITLNKTGKFLFELLKEEKNLEQLVDAMTNTYEVSQEQAKKDVILFIEELKKKNILV